jgi:hypothetical protein
VERSGGEGEFEIFPLHKVYLMSEVQGFESLSILEKAKEKKETDHKHNVFH